MVPPLILVRETPVDYEGPQNENKDFGKQNLAAAVEIPEIITYDLVADVYNMRTCTAAN